MALKKSYLLLTFGEGTCPRSLFLRNSCKYHWWGIFNSLDDWPLSANKQGIIIIAKAGVNFSSYRSFYDEINIQSVSCKKHNFIISLLFSDLRA